MGWEPAQKISGRAWLYPFLTLQPDRSLCRGALQRLEVAADPARICGVCFTYTADAEERATHQTGLQKWWNDVRPANPNFDPKTVLDPEGHFKQDVFGRLRRERDDQPIVLAE